MKWRSILGRILKTSYEAVIKLILTVRGIDPGSFEAERFETLTQSLMRLAIRPVDRILSNRTSLTAERVEQKYDSLAGSHIANETSDERKWYIIHGHPVRCTWAELKEAVISTYKHFIAPFKPRTVLEVGAGELITLTRLARMLDDDIQYFACDISLGRLLAGRVHFQQTIGPRVHLAKANAVKLPYPDQSIDVVFTSHSLEHMPFDYQEAVFEICRVARWGVILFEPCFEVSSSLQRLRMRSIGYVRGLPPIVREIEDFALHATGMIESGSPFNRTSFFLLRRMNGGL